MRLRLLASAFIAAGLACAAAAPVAAAVLIQIDKPTQVMTVTVDGQVAYRWRVLHAVPARGDALLALVG